MIDKYFGVMSRQNSSKNGKENDSKDVKMSFPERIWMGKTFEYRVWTPDIEIR